jgi:hypothetical protein
MRGSRPREPHPFDSLGGVYLSLGAPAKAVQAYSRALAFDPGFPSGSGLAYALGMLGLANIDSFDDVRRLTLGVRQYGRQNREQD